MQRLRLRIKINSIRYLGSHRVLNTAKLLDSTVQVIPVAKDDAQHQLHIGLTG